MKRILLILLLLIATPAIAATQWFQGTGNAPLQGTTKINDIDTDSATYGFTPLDRLITNYQQSMVLSYASAATLSVSAGEIVVKDSGGTIKLMLQNTTATTLTWADIDTGSEATSTTYYVYAIAASSSSTTATFKISLSATAPSGVTYYKKLGSFYNDAAGNISNIINDSNGIYFGSPSSKTAGVTYQATTNGFVYAYQYSASTKASILIYSDSASTPTTQCAYNYVPVTTEPAVAFGSCFVRAGDYYTVTGSGSSATVNFMSINN